MNTDTLHPTQEMEELTPGILSVLPLFYIGWSDSVLSPSEMEIIHQQLEKMDFLSAQEKAYLKKYSTPKNPPSGEVFRHWVESLQEHAHDLEDIEKKNLAEIGVALAKSSTASDLKTWDDSRTREAIVEMQNTLGLQREGSLKLLLGQIDENAYKTVEHSTSFDRDKMQAILDGEKAEVIRRVKKLIRDPYFRTPTDPNKETKRQWTLERVQALGQQGLGSYAFPAKYGGGERVGDHISVFETLAYGDLSVLIKFGVQFGLFGGAVYSLGTEKHHEQYVRDLGKADLLGCFAMTETGHGSNVKGLETTATYDSDTDTLIIHSPNEKSGKEYIGNALHSEMAAVFCQLIVDGENHGVHAVLVPLRKDGQLLEGIRVEDCGYKVGLNGVDNGRIWFDKVRVPRENLLDKYGSIKEDGTYTSPIENPNRRFFTMLGALVAGRISVGLAGVNAAKSALTIATLYGTKRKQFSPKDGEEETIIMDYPTHQRRLIPRIAKTYAYYIALGHLADEYATATEEDVRKIETDAAGLKAMATWHATDTIQECREACGGKGYLSENAFADLKADTDIFTTFEGDNTVLLQLVAKGLLTEFRKSFHDQGFLTVFRYLSRRWSNTMASFNPVYSRNTSTDHLLDKRFHAHALNYRQEKLLLTVSQRMREYLGKKLSPNDAFLKVQVHMVDLAKAYIENLTLKRFYDKVDTVEEGPEKVALTKMCQLYALSTIEQDKGWFLENDYIEGSKSKAIRRIVTKLCAETRSDIRTYVRSWGIPEELLNAEIIK